MAMFTPSTNVIDKLGPAPSGYALGYMNIINEVVNYIKLYNFNPILQQCNI